VFTGLPLSSQFVIAQALGAASRLIARTSDAASADLNEGARAMVVVRLAGIKVLKFYIK
jgi:hypothetical protein